MFNTLDLHLFSNDVIVFYFRAMSFGLKCISYEKKKKRNLGHTEVVVTNIVASFTVGILKF